MKNKYRFFAFCLCALMVTVSFPASAVRGAGFAYGSIDIVPGSSQGLLTYRSLDARQAQMCDLTTFTCDPSVTSTPPILKGEIDPGSYTLSPSGKLAFVPEVSISGKPVNNLYKVDNGTISSPRAFPVAGTIYRILFTPDEKHAVVRTASALISLDLQSNTVVASVPWSPSDHFSFPAISPDGKFLAYYSPATQSAPVRYFKLVDFAKSKTYSLSQQIDYWDLLSEEDVLFQFSPDGKFLLYKDDRNGPQTLYKVNLSKLQGATFMGERLFTKNYSVSGFMLTDARTLIYLANRETPLRFDLYSYDLITNVLKPVLTSASYYPALKRSGDLILVNQLISSGSQVMAYDLKTKLVRALPQPKGSLATLKAGIDLTLPSGVHGALLLPDNFNPAESHQLVIWLHGGPYRQTSLGYHPYPSYGVYDWMLEGLRESGVVVLKLDYHGSFGYGRPFAESLKDNVGVIDVKDILASLDSLKAKYKLSNAHLMGVSYGGYLALRTLVEKPASFASAISINGVSDWLTLVNSNPNTIFAADFRGPLTIANQALYDRASIWGGTPKLTTQKVVLLHSDGDTEVSFSQSVKLADILKRAGKNILFTPLPNDDHVLRYQSNAVTVCTTTFQTLGIAPADKCTLSNLQ